jgi:hypothetical protein
MQRSKEEYYEFIDAILHDIMGGRRDPIISAIQIVRGHNLPRPRIQPWRFLRLPSRRRLVDTRGGRAPRAAKTSTLPLLGARNPRARNPGTEAPAMDPVLTLPRGKGWDDSPALSTDAAAGEQRTGQVIRTAPARSG